MPTGYGQTYEQGVKYLKINRYDSGGLDRSDYLSQLDNLIINYGSSGSVNYNIVTVQEQNDYFIYGIQTKNQFLTSSHYEVLNYNFSASAYPYFSITASIPPPNVYAPVIINNYTESYDNLNYFNAITGTYTFGNTPNIQIEATYSFRARVSTGTVGIDEAFIHFMLFGNTHPSNGFALKSVSLEGVNTSSTTFTGSFIVNPRLINNILGTSNNHVIKNDYIQVLINNTTDSPGTINISRLNIFFTQSVNPNLPTSSFVIFNPEFIDWDYNDYNALLGNAETPQISNQFMDVDYISNDTPINFSLIISGTADRAFVQDSNYSSKAWTDIRYNGVKSEAPGVNELTTKGGYGALPNTEQNKTYIAYFDGVGGTGPEIIEQTAYFIKYIIDTEGNISNPEPGVPSLYNLIDSFETDKKAIVRLIGNDPNLTENPNDDALTGIHNITHVGRIANLLVTETGSLLNHYVTTMSFQNSNFTPIFGTAYDYNIQAVKTGSVQTMSLSWTPVEFQQVNLDNNALWNSSDYSIIIPNDTATTGLTRVKFRYHFIPSPYQYETYETVYGQTQNIINVESYIYGVRIVTASSGDPSNFNHVLTEQILYNFGDDIEYNSPTWYNFQSGDKIRLEMILISPLNSSIFNPISVPGVAVNSYFRTLQEISPGLQIFVDGVNQTTASYWTTSQYDNSTSVLTASAALSTIYSGDYIQLTPTGSLNFGFHQVSLPFKPQVGDWIRFEYNKNKVFNITQVYYIEGILYIKTNPGIPSGTQLNHFVLYRILNDGTYVILNIKKPYSGSSFTGIIQPEYISQDLKDNYNNIIQDLTQKGLIS